MKCKSTLLAALALLMTCGAALADTDADQDTTPITQCKGLPPSVSVAVFSWSETTKVCQEMIRVLQGIRHRYITNFEKSTAVLHYSSQSYGTDDMQILKELIEIIRLRGLFDKPDRWYDTNDLIIRAWTAQHQSGDDR
jgi:hypothetical protein